MEKAIKFLSEENLNYFGIKEIQTDNSLSMNYEALPDHQEYIIDEYSKKILIESIKKTINNKINSFHNLYISLEQLFDLKDMLIEENITSADNFLQLVMQANTENYNWQFKTSPLLVEIQYELVEFAIQKGANVNVEIKYEMGSTSPLELTTNSKLITLLKSHGAKCGIDSERISSLIDEENLYQYKYNAQYLSDQLYENMVIEKSSINKIPYLIHHVWLTHPSAPNEISANDIENILNTKNLFTNDDGKWNHIIWTNDKSLIPNSVKKLEENNIEVKSINDYEENIRSFDLIKELINKKQWGIASDVLRYNLIEHFGGVYSDLNFEFVRSIEDDIYKYNFFAQNSINYFFGAKPCHPIMTNLVDMVERNLNSPASYIANIDDNDIFTKTVYVSLLPFSLSYLKSSNIENNVDIIYPPIDENADFTFTKDEEWLDSGECLSFWNIFEFTDSLGICGISDLLIGDDGYKNSHLTWME